MTEVGLLTADPPINRLTNVHQLPYRYPTSPFLFQFYFSYPFIIHIYFISLPIMNSQSFSTHRLRVSITIPIFVLLFTYIITDILNYNRLVLYCGQYSRFYAPTENILNYNRT
jgi:hypothetical protein